MAIDREFVSIAEKIIDEKGKELFYNVKLTSAMEKRELGDRAVRLFNRPLNLRPR